MLRIRRDEGLTGLWRGTGAALLREASYSSIRMGLYEPFKLVRRSSMLHIFLYFRIATTKKEVHLSRSAIHSCSVDEHTDIFNEITGSCSHFSVLHHFNFYLLVNLHLDLQNSGHDFVPQVLGGDDRAHTPLWIKVTAGASAGVIGSAVANPTDVVMVRMQARPFQTPLGGSSILSNLNDI